MFFFSAQKIMRLTCCRFIEKEMNTTTMPVILCGDLNSEAHMSVCAVLRQSRLNLQSVYDVKGAQAAMPYSTWKILGSGEVKRVIDFIWASRHVIRVRKLLSAPPSEDIPLCRFPNEKYPSDHLALLAELEIVL
eukprot:TRINITY_DN194241_c0_g1_i1.p1 TRINITY_DN194241_c0_g1~~TRINITY_DN194241_c0_g1_i1.p1  ORF type:complete len:134 (+),score=3.20 TRINITY_DN194241_c0_g1_i1:77-478(+)